MTLSAQKLRVHELRVARGGRIVVGGASFEVGAGEIATLEGPNGSGKSTLLRALAGLCPIASGQAEIAGAAGDAQLTEDRDAYQEQTLYGGHLDAVKPALSVRENLAFWALYYGAPAEGLQERLERAMERFALSEIADAPAATCSAGQKRRLGLARFAAIDRPVWLLDEPTVSLDAAAGERFAALLAEHAVGGGLAIVATHAPLGLTPSQRLDSRRFAPSGGGGRDAEQDPFLVDGDKWT